MPGQKPVGTFVSGTGGRQAGHPRAEASWSPQGISACGRDVSSPCRTYNRTAAKAVSGLFPRCGESKASGRQVGRFSALPSRFRRSTDEGKRVTLQAGRFKTGVKLKVPALYWLRLALSPRSPMRNPPQDVDSRAMAVDPFQGLAWRWELARWPPG